jgi:hypothetical protein
MDENGFDVLPDLEPLLYMKKQEEEREEYGLLNDMKGVLLGDVGIYRVSFELEGDYLTAGYMMSALEPKGEDFLDITPVDSIKEQGYELVKGGVIDSIDKMWLAYTLCSKNPELITYTKLTKEEFRKIISRQYRETT